MQIYLVMFTSDYGHGIETGIFKNMGGFKSIKIVK